MQFGADIQYVRFVDLFSTILQYFKPLAANEKTFFTTRPVRAFCIYTSLKFFQGDRNVIVICKLHYA